MEKVEQAKKVFICTYCDKEHSTKEEGSKCILYHWFKDGLIEVDIHTIPKKTVEELIDLDLEEKEKV